MRDVKESPLVQPTAPKKNPPFPNKNNSECLTECRSLFVSVQRANQKELYKVREMTTSNEKICLSQEYTAKKHTHTHTKTDSLRKACTKERFKLIPILCTAMGLSEVLRFSINLKPRFPQA